MPDSPAPQPIAPPVPPKPPPHGAPVLGYGTQRNGLPWQSGAALPPLLIAPLTMCMCGYLDWLAFPFTLAAVVLASWGLARSSSSRWYRAATVIIATVAALLFVKNAADILWFGHDALLNAGA